MKILWGIGTIVFVSAVGWRIGGSLSTDALGMAIGLLFGVMAGIPTALILLASERRTDRHGECYTEPQRPQIAQKPAGPQVVNYITENHYHAAPTVLQDAPRRNRRKEIEARQYRVTSNTEETDR